MQSIKNNKYDHKEIANNVLKDPLFTNAISQFADPNKPYFSIIMPPPNVTGKLHLGHAWDAAIQDLLTRYKRLQGYNVLYLPGSDHAGISTQTKVAQRIYEEQKLILSYIGKQKFLEQAFAWKDEYQTIIKQQWKQLGLLLNYDQEYFTLDEKISTGVKETFVKLYNKGLIYKGKRIIMWDPKLKTALSNIEVDYQTIAGKMYYFKYFLADSEHQEFLPVATTRPETMFADVCVVVNSQDFRYQSFLNKKVINPANGEAIIVIADDYVSPEFGTGAMKCTPGHDQNDFEIGQRHNLEVKICIDLNNKMTALAGKFSGLDANEARDNVSDYIKSQGALIKIEDYEHQIGFSQRSGALVQPILSEQWFVSMKPLVEPIIDSQKNAKKSALFFPQSFNDNLLYWLENIQDWCISRQLWWGHQIPVWYHNQTKEIYIGTTPPTNIADYTQDPDVLDTWFSSAIIPFVTLNNNENLTKFYPSSVLVTAYDILFFWVARMMVMGWEFTGSMPFDHVLIHGLIRDPQGRKMSKSLNNGVDPLEIIDKYGADALRMFLVTNSSPGQDLRYDETKVAFGWNLANKLWNAAKFVTINTADDFVFENSDYLAKLGIIDKWILSTLDKQIIKFKTNIDNYEFGIANKELISFIWDDFCAWYIELAKVEMTAGNASTLYTLHYVLDQICILLHPFMPFITQTIYQELRNKNIINACFPVVMNVEFSIKEQNLCNYITNLITLIREVRKEYEITNKHSLNFHIKSENHELRSHLEFFNTYLSKLTNSYITSISATELKDDEKIIKIKGDLVIEISSSQLPSREIKDQSQELVNQLNFIEREINRAKNVLANPGFLKKAPIEKVNLEKAKLEDYELQKTIIIQQINNISENKN